MNNKDRSELRNKIFRVVEHYNKELENKNNEYKSIRKQLTEIGVENLLLLDKIKALPDNNISNSKLLELFVVSLVVSFIGIISLPFGTSLGIILLVGGSISSSLTLLKQVIDNKNVNFKIMKPCDQKLRLKDDLFKSRTKFTRVTHTKLVEVEKEIETLSDLRNQYLNIINDLNELEGESLEIRLKFMDWLLDEFSNNNEQEKTLTKKVG